MSNYDEIEMDLDHDHFDDGLYELGHEDEPDNEIRQDDYENPDSQFFRERERMEVMYYMDEFGDWSEE